MEEDAPDWITMARGSLLLDAVSRWRDAPEDWFAGSFDRLPETLRVNPMSPDSEWVESWLKSCSASLVPWFKGPGSAWEMPFDRGAAEGEVRALLGALPLHETGRVTRQEAVSMLPVLALDPKPGDVVLDLCASPGSKTTQICEHLGDSGAVIANEVISGRVNTLVSNVQRHASKSAVVVQHDGRHIPAVPEKGYDRVLVDAPCTGSGTTRKNPEVWGKWSPSSGLSLHDLQFDLLRRAIRVTRPGGRIVYATCSLDPVENEAVVARALSEGGVRILPGHALLPGVPASEGMVEWPILGDDGKELDSTDFPEHVAPPGDGGLSSELPNCVRIWNDQIGGGGFFLAALEKEGGETPPSGKGEARVDRSDDPDGYPRPIGEEWERILEEHWPEPQDWSEGSSVLVDENGACLPIWFGSKVTPMVNEQEMRVMRAVRGLPIVLDEEE